MRVARGSYEREGARESETDIGDYSKGDQNKKGTPMDVSYISPSAANAIIIACRLDARGRAAL